MPGGIDLFMVGISHRTAPLAVRERLAVVPEQVEDMLRALAAQPSIREVALISTCNRVEIYGVSSDPDLAVTALRHDLAARAGTTDRDLSPHLYVRVDVDAVQHLFRVAASLDSLVVGEPQILGQVKDAFDTAVTQRTAGQVLGSCFSAAFRVARRVRRETEIARNPVSISSVAIEYARNIFEGFAGRTVLIVGAGKMAGLAARALKGQGADLLVTNRTPGRAEELAARIGGRVHPFEDLAGALERADIVIASTGARQAVLTRGLISRIQRRRRGRLLFLIDIAVPRDVDPACAEVADVFVADLDDLQRLADQHREGRRAEADRAEALVEQEVSRFLEAYRGRRVAPIITAMRQRFLGVAAQETERMLAGLSGLGDRERAAVRQLVEGVVKKLLHEPQVALKRGGADPIEGAGLVAAAQRLFNLEVPEPGAPDSLAGESSESQDAETPPGQSPRKIVGQ